MQIDEFIASRQADWARLSALLDRGGLRRLSALELEELGVLYRAATSDLALAQRDFSQHRVTTFLNQLVGRAHAAVYRGEPFGWRRVARFFTTTFPRLYRQTLPFTLTALGLFIVPALVAGLLTARSTEAAEWLGLGPIVTELESGSLWTDIPISQRPFASSFIMTNNIQVSFIAFAGGVLLGSLTVYALMFNGLHLGGILGLSSQFGLADELLDFIIAHGVIELSVIFAAGGSGLQLAWALLRPGPYRRRDALARAGRIAVRIVAGCIPLLIVAGLIEGFISPSALPTAFKVGVGLSSGALLYTYWLKAGKRTSLKPAPRMPGRRQ
jgi:uncharacterized membrane protein SpoIIM required for sporulation